MGHDSRGEYAIHHACGWKTHKTAIGEVESGARNKILVTANATELSATNCVGDDLACKIDCESTIDENLEPKITTDFPNRTRPI